MAKSLKTIIYKHLEKFSSREFIVFVLIVMAFLLALIAPSIRGGFLSLAEAVCSKVSW